MEHLNIIIVNTQPIPSSGAGAASVNRILSYTKGLIKNDNNVRILSTATSDDNNWQEYEGVPVRHLGKYANNKIKKILQYIQTSFILLHSLQKEKKDVVMFVTSNYPLTILLEIYCKLTRTKIVNERSEFPFVIMNNSWVNKLIAPIYINTAYKMLDGMIVMTKPLIEYYKKKTKLKCEFLEVPMTVDTSRFENIEKKLSDEFGNYIAYCGSMGGDKDGVSNLIKAFSIVEKKGVPLSLLLIGGTNTQTEYDNLVILNDNLKNKNVVFYGKVNRDAMPPLLQNAKILALARPSSLQSTGGFPTKLGEYLATGNPVLVTAVGDIPYYLQDKINAFVVPPDDIEAFANAICYIWEHYSEATKIGEKGRELAQTVFNGDYQAKRIEQFLKKILASES